jgi:RNA polymerase sigma-70 factor (ECF subfamily)
LTRPGSVLTIGGVLLEVVVTAERGGARRRNGGLAPDRRSRGWLATLLERQLPDLLTWAHGRLPRRARRRLETGDLVQEAALGALLHLEECDLEHPGRVQAYLRQSIRHRIIDEIRRADRVELGSEDGPDDAADRRPSPESGAIVSEERRRFRAALRRLDEDERILVVGRVDLELSYEELALATGRPTPDAARFATKRAVVKLAREIGRTGAAGGPGS